MTRVGRLALATFTIALGGLLSAPLRAAPISTPSTQPVGRKAGIRWYVVPNVAFDNDDGLGFGVRGELAIDAPGYAPYKQAFVAHAFASLRGYHHHRLRYDRVGIGAERRFRLTLHLAWRQWLNDGYWGIGNGTTRERRFVGSFDDDDPARKRYRYSLMQPFAHATLRARLLGPLSCFGSLNIKWSLIDTYADSLLGEQRPFGMDGGLGAILGAGVIYDTRFPEANPRRGVYLELSGRGALPLPESAGTFGGLLAIARGYYSLTPWLIVAGRLMSEYLFGDIPFYELVHWGGATPVTGFGGFETLRGLSFGRFRAPGKALANLELRVHVLEHRAGKQKLIWQLAALSDVGTVFGAGDLATGVQAHTPVHPTVGGGLRVVYAEAFVGRLDMAVGFDPVREPDGRLTFDPTFGVYVVFDQAF